ncbi:MAG: hypothetical protein Kow00121_30150 [Elainellaceae cyanobacterium]
MATNSQNSSQWDFGRFMKTLSYFGAIPLLSDLDWFQQWLGSQANPKVDSSRLAYSQSSSTAANHSQEAAPMTAQTDRPIFDFTQPSPNLHEIWGALDDVVMGGVSQSGIRFQNSVAEFAGNVSTANSGGFASVRTRDFQPPLDLSGFSGIELRVRGDGNRYKFMLRTETRWDGIAHCFSFDTVADAWITVRVPFADLIPVFRAKTVPGATFNPSQIYAMQLMLSKFEYDGALNPHFQPGAFQLQIESIQAYV